MLSEYWLLSDLDGTLISTPHKANGSYLPITRSPCYNSIRRWLLHGGNICIVTTADERVIDQVYTPLRPFLQRLDHPLDSPLRGSDDTAFRVPDTQTETMPLPHTHTRVAHNSASIASCARHHVLPATDAAATTSVAPALGKPGELLLSLYSGAVLYRCTAHGVERVTAYMRRTHCVTKEAAALMRAMGLPEQRYHTCQTIRAVPKDTIHRRHRTIHSGLATPTGKDGLVERAESWSSRSCIGVTGTCLASASHAVLMDVLTRSYNQLIDDVLHGQHAALHGLQQLSQRYRRMWVALLTVLDDVYRCSDRATPNDDRSSPISGGGRRKVSCDANPKSMYCAAVPLGQPEAAVAEAGQSCANDTGAHATRALGGSQRPGKDALEGWVQRCRTEPAAVAAWKVRYLRSRHGLLAGLGMVRAERVWMHDMGFHSGSRTGASNVSHSQSGGTSSSSSISSSSSSSSISSHVGCVSRGNPMPGDANVRGDVPQSSTSEPTSAREYVVQILTKGVTQGPNAPPCMRVALGAFVDEMDALLGGLPPVPFPDQRQAPEDDNNIAQIIVLGIPLALYSRYFAHVQSDFARAGAQAMPQPNSVVLSKLGINKSTVLRYLLGKECVVEQQPTANRTDAGGGGGAAAAAAAAAASLDYLGCVDSARCVAIGDNPHTTDYELTVFPEVPFVSVERDEQRHRRHDRIHKLHATLGQGSDHHDSTGSGAAHSNRIALHQSPTHNNSPSITKGSHDPEMHSHAEKSHTANGVESSHSLSALQRAGLFIDSQLRDRLRRSGPLMDDRMLAHLLYVGGEECGTAFFLDAWMNYLRVPPHPPTRPCRAHDGTQRFATSGNAVVAVPPGETLGCGANQDSNDTNTALAKSTGASVYSAMCTLSGVPATHVDARHFRSTLALAQRTARSQVQHSTPAKL